MLVRVSLLIGRGVSTCWSGCLCLLVGVSLRDDWGVSA